jgi:hypothetical protein
MGETLVGWLPGARNHGDIFVKCIRETPGGPFGETAVPAEVMRDVPQLFYYTLEFTLQLRKFTVKPQSGLSKCA